MLIAWIQVKALRALEWAAKVFMACMWLCFALVMLVLVIVEWAIKELTGDPHK